MRVFEMAAVGRLSIRPSRLASEDLPELDSPQMARRSGRSRRCCVRRSARTAGNSFEPGRIALSSILRASFNSATIRLVRGWSDTTGAPVLRAPFSRLDQRRNCHPKIEQLKNCQLKIHALEVFAESISSSTASLSEECGEIGLPCISQATESIGDVFEIVFLNECNVVKHLSAPDRETNKKQTT